MGLTGQTFVSSTIALDTNIFIHALDDSGSKGETARSLLAQIKRTSPRVFISVLVLEEFFVKIYKQKREKDTAYYLDFLTGGGLITLVDITRQIALLAAKIRAEFEIKAPDAIHLACACESGAKVFITTDKRLPKKIGKLSIEMLK